ncbi:MAG TPA: MFS transporter [Bacteroidetes bacterium]|nr:MFS transporter [Bacteroidota bacterium]
MSKQKSPLLPIFVTVFLDMLGVGIIIPVIPALFFEGNEFFGPEVAREYKSILYGLLLASYPFMQFFGAPLLGMFSDRYGRKPMLTLSLTGTMLGYVLFAYAIGSGSVFLLFFSRMFPGFFGGNISIVYSAIADVSDEKSKPKNFGLVGMAFGLGFILGPTLGGIMADETVVGWFSPATPFIFTSILTFLNILLVKHYFRETLPALQKGAAAEVSEKTKPLSWGSIFNGFRNIATSFREADLRVIFTVVLLLSLGFSFYAQFFSVLLIEGFSYSEKDIGFLFGWIGVWLVFTQGFIVPRLSKVVSPKIVPMVSLLGQSIFIGLVLLPGQSFWFYIINPFIALFHGVTTPNLTTVVSMQAGADRQGEVMGINQSMLSLGQIVPPVLGGYLNTLNGNFPILVGAAVLFAGWAVYVFVFQRR